MSFGGDASSQVLLEIVDALADVTDAIASADSLRGMVPRAKRRGFLVRRR